MALFWILSSFLLAKIPRMIEIVKVKPCGLSSKNLPSRPSKCIFWPQTLTKSIMLRNWMPTKLMTWKNMLFFFAPVKKKKLKKPIKKNCAFPGTFSLKKFLRIPDFFLWILQIFFVSEMKARGIHARRESNIVTAWKSGK